MAAGDIKIPYRSSNDKTWINSIFPKVNSGLLGMDATGIPVGVTIGGGLTLVSGVLSATGTGGGSGSGSVTSAELVALSAQMTSADNAISAAVAVVNARVTSVMSAISVESASRAAADTSLDGRATSIMSAVSVESAARAAQAISIMSAVSVESAGRAAADTSLDGRATSIMSAVSVNSAQMTSADNAISAVAANAVSIANAVSNRLSALVLDSIANVSVPSPSDQQVLAWNSAAQQWIPVSVAAGSGSVTSNEASAISAAAASADATLSTRIVSVMSAVSVESAARAAADTSLDGRATSIMSAVSVESAARAAQAVSIMSAVSVNSAQMTSADNRLSANIASVDSVARNHTGITIVSATLDGITNMGGTFVTSAAAMGALAVDVTKGFNTKTISADQTLTFSGTPGATNQWFGLFITNSDSAAHTLTLPANVFSVNRNATVGSIIIPASGKLRLTWHYDGSVYNMYGDPVTTAAGTGDYLLVSAPSPGDGQVPAWNSAAQQWLPVSVAAGSGSVTSNEASAISAFAAARATSIMSAVSVNSAQMTSAINVVSNAVSVLSAALIPVSADPTDGQVLMWRSVDQQWIASTVAAGSGSVTSNEASAISAAAASADATLSGKIISVMSAVSVESASRAAADTSLDGRATSIMSAVSVESAARAAADTSLDGRATSIMSAVSVESAARAAADISIMSAVSVESAARAAADTSLDGRATSIMSAVSVESAARAAADISIMSAVSVESAARAAQAISIMSAISVNSAQMTSADNAISAVAANAQSIANAVSNRVSALVLDDLANLSVPSPADGHIVMWNSSEQQWVASSVSVIGGLGSVTSNEASAISAAAASADATLSARITSVMSAVSINSAQMTSADNAISAVAADALSVANAASNAVSVLSAALVPVSANPVSGNIFVWKSASAQWVASSNAAWPMQRILTGAQLVTATAVVSVSGFTFTVSNGGTYGFDFNVINSSPISTAAPQYMLSGPSPTFLAADCIHRGGIGDFRTALVAFGGKWTGFTTVSAVGVNRAMRLQGTFLAAANGTVALKVGNNISGPGAGSAITIAAGSYGYLWRIA